jgi:hypothetical protein
MTILDILNEIGTTASRNEKQVILEKHKNNETLKNVFFLAYSPMETFYIKKIPEYKKRMEPVEKYTINLDQAMKSLGVLSNRDLTGHAGIAYLRDILSGLMWYDAEVLERIVEKDLRISCSDSTANKVWTDLVPSFPVMLCTPYDEKLISKFKFPGICQLKMDSMRVTVICKSGNPPEYRSRNGKLLDIPGDINDDFLKIADGMDVVFDGEIWVADNNGNIEKREIGNGILLRAQKTSLSDDESKKIRVTLWDRIPYNDFMSGVYNVPYSDRWEKLQNDYVPSMFIDLVPTFIVNNIDETVEIFENYIKDGQEGIILKSPGSEWSDKRSKQQIKFKAEKDCELICTDWFYGKKKTKNEFRLGFAEFQSSDGLVCFNIGTGFSDTQRDYYTKENMVGTIWKITYNIRLKPDAKTGKVALFLSRVIEQRHDKSEADHSSTIK